jgi:hypothetical protein
VFDLTVFLASKLGMARCAAQTICANQAICRDQKSKELQLICFAFVEIHRQVIHYFDRSLRIAMRKTYCGLNVNICGNRDQ